MKLNSFDKFINEKKKTSTEDDCFWDMTNTVKTITTSIKSIKGEIKELEQIDSKYKVNTIPAYVKQLEKIVSDLETATDKFRVKHKLS